MNTKYDFTLFYQEKSTSICTSFFFHHLTNHHQFNPAASELPITPKRFFQISSLCLTFFIHAREIVGIFKSHFFIHAKKISLYFYGRLFYSREGKFAVFRMLESLPHIVVVVLVMIVVLRL